MALLDALLGRVQSDGTELELEGGLNFTTGLYAEADSANNRINVKSRAAVTLVGIGQVYLTASDVTDLTEDVFVAPEGSYAINSLSSADFTLGSADYPTVTYGGSATVRIALLTSVVYESAAANKFIAFQHWVNDTGKGVYTYEYANSAVEKTQSLNTLVTIESGDEFGLRMTNLTDNNDATVNSLMMFWAAFATA